MKLYHLPRPADAAPDFAHTIEQTVAAAGGRMSVSRGMGATADIFVLYLPDTINPEEIGLEGATWVADLPA